MLSEIFQRLLVLLGSALAIVYAVDVGLEAATEYAQTHDNTLSPVMGYIGALADGPRNIITLILIALAYALVMKILIAIVGKKT